MHVSNTQETEAGKCEFVASLEYTARPSPIEEKNDGMGGGLGIKTAFVLIG